MKKAASMFSGSSDSAAVFVSKSRMLVISAGFALFSVLGLWILLAQKIPIVEPAQGILWPKGGLSRVVVMREGIVESLMVKEGGLARVRQPLIVVRHRMIPKEEVEELKYQESVLKERLNYVQESIDRRKEGGLAADLELMRLEDQLLHSQVANREALVAIRDKSSTVLYAPRRGRVIEIRTTVGAEVQPNQAVATIVDEAPDLEVLAYVTPEVASRLNVGGVAKVNWVGAEGRNAVAPGTISKVSSLPVSPKDVDRSIVLEKPHFEVLIAMTDREAIDTIGSASPGKAVRVEFQIDDKSLFEWMFSRFSVN